MSQLILENAKELIISILDAHGYACETHIIIEENPTKNSICYFSINNARRSGFIVWRQDIKELAYVYMDMNKLFHLEQEGFSEKFLNEEALIYNKVDSLNEFIEVLINKTAPVREPKL